MKYKNSKLKLIYLVFNCFLLSNIYCTDTCENCIINSDKSCVPNDGSSTCPESCKTSLVISTGNCFNCDFSSINQYYSISNDGCSVKQYCEDGEKLIYGTKECIGTCGEFFEFGDYCYRSNPNLPNTELDGSSKVIKCQYNYYITKENGIKLFNCLGVDQECPPEYNAYYVEKKLCFQGECANLNIDNIRTKEKPSNKIECSISCQDGDYYKIEENGRELCVSSCYPQLKLENGEKKCIEFNECKRNLKYQKGEECVDKSQCEFYYENKCESSCDSVGYNVFNTQECVRECTGSYKYLHESEKICYNDCPSGYISEDEKRCIPRGQEDRCFYIEEVINKKCLSVCPSEYLYHNIGENKCLPNCASNENQKKYFEYGKFICYESCNDIFTDSTSFFFSQKENGDFQCFSDETKCINAGYKYVKYYDGNKECVTSCPDIYFLVDFISDSLGGITTLGKCFETVGECKNNGYIYYNSQLHKCWASFCPNDMNTNENGSDGKPIDVSGNTCVYDCPSSLPKLSGNICKSTCFPNEYSDPQSREPNKCIESCGEKKIGPNNECLVNCLYDYYYINDNGKMQCTTDRNCPSSSLFKFINDNQCYRQCSKNVNGKIKHYFYNSQNECLETCKDNTETSKKYAFEPIDSPQICRELPAEKYYYEIDNIIRDNCILYDSTNTQKCLTSCPDGFVKIEGEKKICVSGCNSGQYFYETTIEILGNTLRINICVSDCKDISNNYNYILRSNNKCMELCPDDYYYKVGDSCYLKCPGNNIHFLVDSDFHCSGTCSTNIYEKLSSNYHNVYFCKESCNDKPYFTIIDGKTECLAECPEDYNYIQSDNECKQGCPNSGYTNYKLIKKEPYDIYKCIDSCNDNLYYSKEESLCFSICLDSRLNKFSLIDTDGKRKCVPGCVNHDGQHLYFTEENKVCMPGCDQNTEYKYNIENEYKCIKECPKDYHKEGTVCVRKCGNSNPYLNDNNECVDVCPEGKQFFIGHFTHGEIDDQKRCLNDCTNLYPYYIEKSGTIINYECKEDCSGVYLINSPTKIGKKCLSSVTNCPNASPDIYPYKYDINNKIECYSVCPSDKYYIDINKYVDYSGPHSKQCLIDCPSEFYFHEINSNKCLKPEDCPLKFADYDSRNCVSECKKNYISEIKDSDGNLKATICLSSCNEKYGKYLTPDKKCVSDCTTYSSLLKNDNSFKCICQNLYYYDDSNIMTCINIDINNCQSNTNEYKISKAESNECLKNCKGILSVNEDICYDNNFVCSQDNINTELITKSNGQKKCECKYKYYYENGMKTCYGESDDCSPGKLYIPETNGCVDSCISPYVKKFDNFCLRNCPENSVEDNVDHNLCICNHYWYSLTNQNFICLNVDKCPKSHPLLNVEDNQCLKKCKDNDNLIIDKCVSSCTSGTSKTLIPTFASEFKYAKYYCLCNNVWYYDVSDQENKCSLTETTCSNFYPNSKFIVKNTKQCVISCPEDYPYSFNSECLHTCEDHQYEYYIKTISNSKVCQCIYLWKYDNNNNYICLTTGYCPNSPEEYVQIVDTKECLKGNACPPESPLLFNKKCYKINKCPENSYYDNTIEGTCTCDNLWYKYNDPNIVGIPFIFCLHKNVERCPMHYTIKYPYQIYSTKECLKEGINCPENSYVFNYICYENGCPKNTTEDVDSFDNVNNIHYCICDKTSGYWYKYPFDESYREYLQCGLEKCEGEYFNLYIKENECLKSCDVKIGEETHNPMVSFRGNCYEECPDFTKPKEDFIYECGFYKLNEANSLEQLRDYANIQVRELYEISNKGGYLFNNSETSVQIYGIDKENNINDKYLILKSNLAYIDLGTCTEKIYTDNKLSDDDKILVIKYDMLSFNIKQNSDISDISNNNDYYLINPVEYEFFSSSTGEKIDASICEPYEITVSYPISYTIKKYDEFENGMNINEYKKKFEVGKELSHKNKQIDVFNSNNSVYKDICVGVELNGKDLVLEDRYEYLYPNNITLCENNCTFDYTDYEFERIICKCNYKKELDFHREYPEASDLLNDPDFNNPTQSGSNGEIIKCLSKFPSKDSIIKNEAFYYCTVVTAAEISMIFVAAFHGLKAVSSNITSLMNKPSIKMNIGNQKQMPRSKFKNDNNIITTSHRALNNPPKKGNIIISDKNDNDEEEKKSENIPNIINKKNIEIINFNKKNNNIYNDYESENISDENESNNNYGIGLKDIGTKVSKNNNNLIDNQNQNNNNDYI